MPMVSVSEIETEFPALADKLRQRYGLDEVLQAGRVIDSDPGGVRLRRAGRTFSVIGPFWSVKAWEADGTRSMAVTRKG